MLFQYVLISNLLQSCDLSEIILYADFETCCSRNIYLLLSMLNIGVLLNIFVETVIHFYLITQNNHTDLNRGLINSSACRFQTMISPVM